MQNNSTPTGPNLAAAPTNNTKKSSGGHLAVNLLIIVVVVFGALYAISMFTPLNILGLQKNSSATDVTAWKAVFLSNGQVYFGHTVNENSDPVVLRDIYYLQVTQPLQQVGANQNPPNPNQPQLSLVKLGNELHGPEDEMRVNREHVLFIEDLKEDGRVVEAINSYVAGQSE